jgi:hypothetical protein
MAVATNMLLEEKFGILEFYHSEIEIQNDMEALERFNRGREGRNGSTVEAKLIRRPRVMQSNRSELDYWRIEKEFSYRYFQNKYRNLKLKQTEEFKQSVRIAGDINEFQIVDPLDKDADRDLADMPLQESRQVQNYDHRLLNHVKQMLVVDD